MDELGVNMNTRMLARALAEPESRVGVYITCIDRQGEWFSDSWIADVYPGRIVSLCEPNRTRENVVAIVALFEQANRVRGIIT